jgi:chitinase
MDGQTPIGGYDCGDGKKFVTHRKGHCGKDRWEPFCCDDDIGNDACQWRANYLEHCYPGCESNEISFGQHNLGGGYNCQYPSPGGITPGSPQINFVIGFPKLCCNAEALETKLKELPIPLQNLFPDWQDIPDSDEQKFEVEMDETMGGQRKATKDDHPDANSFGWHIMSGPDYQLLSLRKRDGSHWRVYDCDAETHERRQTAKMVCTDGSEGSNCHKIFKGGVERTVIEMPQHCGPGKYAMAVGMRQLDREEVEASLPEDARRKLWKRGIEAQESTT